MVQEVLKGKDESGNVGVPRGHPADQGLWVWEKEGPHRRKGTEGEGGREDKFYQ